jgi:hypothetical protein
MRKITLNVPTAHHSSPVVITLCFRDDPADLSPASASIGYARWRMPAEMPAYRPRGENAALDLAWDQWDQQEELVMLGVLTEVLGQAAGLLDQAGPDITWARAGGRLVADCALTREGRPVDLTISEPGR